MDLIVPVVNGRLSFPMLPVHPSDQVVRRFLTVETTCHRGRATFLARAGGGLYWLLPTVAPTPLGGLVSAWLFLLPEN
jgi:hypothetical protein